MVFLKGYKYKNEELTVQLNEIISSLGKNGGEFIGDSMWSLIDCVSCIEHIATELSELESVETKTKTKADLQVKLEELKEGIKKTSAKFVEARLELEQVQVLNKNKQSQKQIYIKKTNELKSLLSTLNDDITQMQLDKKMLKDREIKLKQEAIECSAVYEVERLNQEKEIDSLKKEIEMIWTENMKMESERLYLRVRIEDEQDGQIINMENSKRFINLLETEVNTLLDNHCKAKDRLDTNLKLPEKNKFCLNPAARSFNPAN